MIRIAVIDDEPLARSGVVALLAGSADVDIVAEYENGPDALNGIRQSQPDLVFIDIDMPGMNGLDVLAAIAPPSRPMAILLTAYANFALRAFELNVIDYLLKPVNEDRFFEAMDRARCALPYRSSPGRDNEEKSAVTATRYVETLTVRTGNRLILVNVADISWIAADGDYVTLYAGNKQHLLRESTQRIAQQLDPARFVRIHRSTIIRLDQVAELRALNNRDALLRLLDGTPLRVSRTYTDNLIESLQRYRGCNIT